MSAPPPAARGGGGRDERRPPARGRGDRRRRRDGRRRRRRAAGGGRRARCSCWRPAPIPARSATRAGPRTCSTRDGSATPATGASTPATRSARTRRRCGSSARACSAAARPTTAPCRRGATGSTTTAGPRSACPAGAPTSWRRCSRAPRPSCGSAPTRTAELTPWQRAWFDAGPAAGLPQLRDVNGLDEGVGVAPESVNVVGAGVRFNNAFAYLDPVRGLDTLTIVGDALVDRVLIGADGAARGVAVSVSGGAPQEVASPLVILCGGAYCTPTVLLRSGVGPAAQLRALGIDVAPTSCPASARTSTTSRSRCCASRARPQMAAAMDAAVAAGWAPDEQVIAKAASRFEREAFDLHLLPVQPDPPPRRLVAGTPARARCGRARAGTSA